MHAMQLDHLGHDANRLIISDLAGIRGIWTNLTLMQYLIDKLKVARQMQPSTFHKNVILNVPRPLEVFISAKASLVSSADVDAIEFLPFPYSLEKLLQLSSLDTLRQHARMLRPHPMEGGKQIVPSGGMAEFALDVKGPVKWALDSANEVELSVYFISSSVDVLMHETCRVQADSFTPPRPGLLWLRAVNHSWSSVKLRLGAKQCRS